jgi:hypothetical protein
MFDLSGLLERDSEEGQPEREGVSTNYPFCEFMKAVICVAASIMETGVNSFSDRIQCSRGRESSRRGRELLQDNG